MFRTAPAAVGQGGRGQAWHAQVAEGIRLPGREDPGESGVAVLHELMRHSSMQVTMDFYANVDDTLQDAIGRLT